MLYDLAVSSAGTVAVIGRALSRPQARELSFELRTLDREMKAREAVQGVVRTVASQRRPGARCCTTLEARARQCGPRGGVPYAADEPEFGGLERSRRAGLPAAFSSHRHLSSALPPSDHQPQSTCSGSLAHLSSDHCCLGSSCCRALGHPCDPASAAPVVDAPGLTRLFDSLSSIPSPRSEASFYEGMRTLTSYASQNDLKDDDDLLSDLLVVRRASTLLREGRAHRRVVGGRPRLDPRTT
jgi:hypothetical protein